MGTPAQLPLDPHTRLQARLHLRSAFPALGGDFLITSPQTEDYNCIGWAAEDDSSWWWPSKDSFWPQDAPFEVTVDAFVTAFGTMGYQVCTGAELEPGIQKVALYMKEGMPTHMARQLESGAWTSKLGQSYDIQHQEVKSVEGASYGDAVVFMKRALTTQGD